MDDASGPQLFRAVARERHTASASAPHDAPDRTRIALSLDITGPLHIGGARTNPEDRPIVLSLAREQGQATITGATWKGLLRARMEFILRTVEAQPAPCLNATCSACWPCLVFGHGGGSDPTSNSVGLRSRLRFFDSPILDAHTATRPHVAIDRFTGGARDRWLYTMEGIESGRLQLVVDVDALEESELAEFRALLRLVAADLDEGIVGVGGATTRGYGSVHVALGAAEQDGALPDLVSAQRTVSRMVDTSREKTNEPTS